MPAGLAGAFASLSTSGKLILILTLALMPLGAVALLTSIESARSADSQRRTDVQVAATGAARLLGAELTADILALRRAVSEIEASPVDRSPCRQVNAVLVTNPRRRVQVALYGPASLPICASPSLGSETRPMTLAGTFRNVIIRRDDDTFDLIVFSDGGSSAAVARYRADVLAQRGRPSGFTIPYDMTVNADGGTIEVARGRDTGFGRSESATVPVGIGDLSVTLTVAAPPFGASQALLAFLPLLMWAAAIGVGFYVVDRFLVRPLKKLRSVVATYEPGTSRLMLTDTPAIEIRELETSFVDFADRLAERERDIELALAAQIKLTREVHHRVKNNLQVVASLISLHARGTQEPDAQRAYAAIQRRVDALAIVHRNHYAELERNLGIDIKTLVSELAANFRANVGQDRVPPTVRVAAASLNVGQDVATPLAFFVTEAAEMALFTDPDAPILIEVESRDAGTACLTVTASAEAFDKREAQAPSWRIIEALARQLRSTLGHDPVAGRVSLEFPVLAEVTDQK